MEHNKNGPGRPRWTDDSVRRLLALWDERLSATRIAVELGPGFTRNAVVGKLFRLGVRRADEQRKADQARGAREAREIAPRRAVGSRRGPPMIPVPPAPPRLCSVVPELVSMAELRPDGCRWPFDGVDGARFCGRPKRAASPYCLGHHDVAYAAALPPLTVEALEGDAGSARGRTAGGGENPGRSFG